MSPKQQRFCKEYLIDLNATQAAIRAGYSEKTATIIGFENLTKPNIKKEIDRLIEERSQRTEITTDMVLKELAKIGFSDIKDFLQYKGNGKEIEISIKDSKDIDGSLINEISLTKEGTFKFKLHDKLNALDKIGKHLKMFTDKVEQSGEIKINVNVIGSKKND